MGEAVSCCKQTPTNGQSIREIISLEDTEACKQWMDGTPPPISRLFEIPSENQGYLQQKTKILL